MWWLNSADTTPGAVESGVSRASLASGWPARQALRRKRGLIAASGLGREVLELALDAVPLLGIGRRFLLDRDIGPGFRVFGVEGQPLLKARLGIGLDRLGRAFGFADAAIDALVRMDDEHVLALVEAIDGAHLHAVQVFALYAVFSDDIGHGLAPAPRFGSGWC